MARGFDLLASSNVNSIDHTMPRVRIENRGGKALGIETTIRRPELVAFEVESENDLQR